MQVPAGKPLAGMAHHKVHDDNWTGLPLLPSADPQPRQLHKPSTAATLNLAATAAQCARLFAPYDEAFADRCLARGPYGLGRGQGQPGHLRHGGRRHRRRPVRRRLRGRRVLLGGGRALPHHRREAVRRRGPGLAGAHRRRVPGRGLRLEVDRRAGPARPGHHAQWTAGSRRGTGIGARRRGAVPGRASTAHPYGLPYAPGSGLFDWGSNNLVLNNMVVMATAYDISGDEKYRDGVLEGMDYILGRNALNQSYVTGYGENASENQHSRWYAHQLNPALPNPPVGTLSGGPNSSIQDPVAQALLQGLQAAVLLHRRHRVVVDQRADHQLELRRCPGSRRSSPTRATPRRRRRHSAPCSTARRRCSGSSSPR